MDTLLGQHIEQVIKCGVCVCARACMRVSVCACTVNTTWWIKEHSQYVCFTKCSIILLVG